MKAALRYAVFCALVGCGTLLWISVAWGQSDTNAAALIERARQKALDYATSLPDFLCTEVLHRNSAPAEEGRKVGGWVATDMLTVKLRYLERKEEHKLELINGKPTTQKFEAAGGAVSTGEFGGVLRMIFDPDSQTVFNLKTWKNERKRRIAVYEYAVSAAHSPYVLRTAARQAIVGLHGVLEIDSETGEVLHMTYIAYDIPKMLGVHASTTTVDYELADVGGRNYLLPVRSEAEVHGEMMWARNKMEFKDYRKFTADSVIDFGTGK